MRLPTGQGGAGRRPRRCASSRRCCRMPKICARQEASGGCWASVMRSRIGRGRPGRWPRRCACSGSCCPTSREVLGPRASRTHCAPGSGSGTSPAVRAGGRGAAPVPGAAARPGKGARPRHIPYFLLTRHEIAHWSG